MNKTVSRPQSKPRRTRRSAYKVMAAFAGRPSGLDQTAFRAINATVPTPLAELVDKAILRNPELTRAIIVTRGLEMVFADELDAMRSEAR